MWHPNKLFGQWQKHEYKYDDLGHIETQTASFDVFGGTLTYIWRKDTLNGLIYLVRFEWVNPNTHRRFQAQVRMDDNLLRNASEDVCLEYAKKCGYEAICAVVFNAVSEGNER